VWALERKEVIDRIYSVQESDAHAWWAEVAEMMPTSDLIRVAVTLWAIWYVRRKAIHEDSFQSSLSTHCFIERYIADLDLIKPEQGKAVGSKQRVARWIPPPADTIKINVDAAISKNTGRAAAAAVARDGAGVFQGASVLVTQGITDPETMEAIACSEGLALASDLAIRRFRMASDNINVVRSIRGEGKGTYGPIVQEIVDTTSLFVSSEFVHEGRASNEDAHLLARRS
jgi:ribonuclease HI